MPPPLKAAAYAWIAVAAYFAASRVMSEEPPRLTRSFLSVRAGGEKLVDDLNVGGSWNVFFDEVTFTESFAPGSVELMKQHVLFTSPGESSWRTGWRTEGVVEGVSLGVGEEVVGAWQLQTDNASLSTAVRCWLEEARFSAYTTAGVRYSKIESGFSFLGIGSILGRASVVTEIDHNLIGPQLGVGGVAEWGMWRLEGTLLGLLGYQRIDYRQNGVFGEEVIPGALNRPAIARATDSVSEYGEEHMAFLGEARLAASCYLTQRLRLEAGWRVVVATEIHSADAATAFNAPDYGIYPTDGDTVAFDYWTLGVTYTF